MRTVTMQEWRQAAAATDVDRSLLARLAWRIARGDASDRIIACWMKCPQYVQYVLQEWQANTAVCSTVAKIADQFRQDSLIIDRNQIHGPWRTTLISRMFIQWEQLERDVDALSCGSFRIN